MTLYLRFRLLTVRKNRPRFCICGLSLASLQFCEGIWLKNGVKGLSPCIYVVLPRYSQLYDKMYLPQSNEGALYIFTSCKRVVHFVQPFDEDGHSLVPLVRRCNFLSLLVFLPFFNPHFHILGSFKTGVSNSKWLAGRMRLKGRSHTYLQKWKNYPWTFRTKLMYWKNRQNRLKIWQCQVTLGV